VRGIHLLPQNREREGEKACLVDGLPVMRRGSGSSSGRRRTRRRPWLDGSWTETLVPRAPVGTNELWRRRRCWGLLRAQARGSGFSARWRSKGGVRFGRWGNEGRRGHELSSCRPWRFDVGVEEEERQVRVWVSARRKQREARVVGRLVKWSGRCCRLAQVRGQSVTRSRARRPHVQARATWRLPSA
jgi:hypothetical protein